MSHFSPGLSTVMPNPAPIPHVAIWIETSRGYGRSLIGGVAAYVQQHGPWSMYFTPHGQQEPLPTWLRKWRGDAFRHETRSTPGEFRRQHRLLGE